MCVGGCFLPPATLHLSVELVRLKPARSKDLKSIHPLSGHRTLSPLTLKAEFPLVSVCTPNTLSESHANGGGQKQIQADGCERHCLSWSDKFLAVFRRWHWVSPAAATWCHVTSAEAQTGREGRADAFRGIVHLWRMKPNLHTSVLSNLINLNPFKSFPSDGSYGFWPDMATAASH